MVHRFVFTIKLNINENSAGHLNFVLMEEESQAVGTVAAEITVNTANRNPSASFAVDLKYVLTTDRNHHVKNVERLREN